MPSPQNTKQLIIDSALVVLKRSGSEGLTLRKVATEAGISLGNLQYHVKDKTTLMAVLVEYYFAECRSLLDAHARSAQPGNQEEQLYAFILFMLDHVDHLSDMCRIFREIWALSARDAQLQEQLTAYYRGTLDSLLAWIKPISGSAQSAEAIGCLILPYIEGYSIAHDALPQSKVETAQMLTRLCVQMCTRVE